MGNSFAIISSDMVLPEAVFSLIQQLGGQVVSEDPPEARLSMAEDHLWIFPMNSALAEMDSDEFRLLSQALGRDPASVITIESTETIQSAEMLRDFALACASVWNCVLYDFESYIANKEELSHLKLNNRAPFN